ncbi:S46 family peptidase [uncultured Sphingomonas sp.]|uniref:S46 family peptidase n=1 Tax=uncultured Sphingomonas sp. TaxID=158754 RepID=UPI00260BABDD|nr:S46 family peptidase [uncultured Sphingomonas sp.]
MRKIAALAATAGLVFTAATAQADEGMWTFDGFPAARMKATYGWAPDQAWLDRVQASAVRLTGGCSASFVSAEGLILTNHHCVAQCAQDLSSNSKDYLKAGFIAGDRAREQKCPGQQAEVVTEITDVTKPVTAAIAALSGEALTKARDAQIAQIEAQNCTDKATTRCQVVTLYGGGQYKLYKYRKYSDVRLVWAPEFAAAFFGGDPDNFNFPRYDLDASFLRAYENGRPVSTPAHLRWNPRGPIANEATFVVGNPGRTQRLLTQDQLAFQREVAIPLTTTLLSEWRGRLIAAGAQSEERRREAQDSLFGTENSYKVYWGQARALDDDAFAATLARNEADLQRRAGTRYGTPWADIAAADRSLRNIYLDYYFLESRAGWTSDLYAYAKALVRAAAERQKPNADRLPGYTDSALPLVEKQLTDAKPIEPWLEEANLSFWLSKAREYLTADNPQVKALLGRESPELLARRLVSGTRLADPAVRKRLFDGGAAAIQSSNDPLIRFVLANDAAARSLRQQYAAQVDAPVTAAQAKIAQARFAAYGAGNYPDATFTLRISFGRVQGWNERGRAIPYQTIVAGLYDRATGADPFELAPAYARAKSSLNLDTPFDFVTTNDIIGGNSGSPVIARDGSVIGAAFDGNIHSLGGNFGYDPKLNRTVVVSAAAVQQALEKVYPAPALVRELAAR